MRLRFPWKTGFAKSSTDTAHASILGVDKGGLAPAVDQSTIDARNASLAYAQSALIFTCIDRISSLLSTVPLVTYKTERGSSGKTTVKRTGVIPDLLTWVNPTLTLSQLVHYTAAWMLLTGDAYWLVEESDEPYRQTYPLSIYPLSPEYVTPLADKVKGIVAYRYRVGAYEKILPANTVVHFKLFNPLGYWQGSSPLNPLLMDMQVERLIKRQLRQYFSNTTMIDGIIRTDNPLDADNIAKIRENIKKTYQGPQNAYKIMILGDGLDYKDTQRPSPSAAISELIKLNTDAQGMVFGVPTGILTGDSAVLPEAKLLMWEQRIQPLGQLIQEVITKRLCLPVSTGLSVAFNYSNVTALRLKDLDRTRVEVAHVNTGIRTVNEVREDRGWDRIETEFADALKPEWESDQKSKIASSGSSPSLPLTGTQGGRDQSVTGEAQMVDQTGQKNLSDLDED